MGFVSELVVREHDEHSWVLEYQLVYAGNSDDFVVPKGFHTDFASTPRALWSWVPPSGLYTKAAVLHDWLYQEQPEGVSRKDADKIFRRTMQKAGVGWFKRQSIYWAVRAFGRRIWKKYKK